MSLRSLFDASAPRSRDLFTNRVSEAAAFGDALGLMKSEARRQELLDDLWQPCRNVLNFYGLGGAGKSALTDHLRLLVPSHRFGPGVLVAQFDMSIVSARSSEAVLIGMRAVLASAGIPAAAFDLAFARYWALTRPGQVLHDYLSHETLPATLGRSLDLGAVMQDAVSDLVETVADAPGFGVVGLTLRVARSVVNGARSRSRVRVLMDDCPHLADALVAEDARDLLAFLPRFLAWDLHAHTLSTADVVPENESTLLVVFMDDWEEVQAVSEFRGSVEDDLSALVALMPNVLFVIAGRERLTWADPSAAAALRITGPRRWPGLVPGATAGVRQHRVGPLSEDDSRSFLTKAIPGTAPDIIDAIVRASRGHPDYLDCAVALCLERRREGVEPSRHDLSGSFPQLFTRLMRGLKGAERELMQAAAQLPAFSVELLHHLVPQATRGEVAVFASRHFIEPVEGGWLGLRLARTARGIVRESPPREVWPATMVASARLEAATWISSEAVRGGTVTRTDRERLAQALMTVVDLVGERDVLPRDVLVLLLAANAAGVDISGAATTPTLFASVASLLLAIEHERAEPARVRQLVSRARPGWLADLGWVTLARKALLSADAASARSCMERIGSSDPVLADRRDKLVTLIASREGRFEEARSSLEAWSPGARETPGFADLYGHIEFWNGNFDQASDWFAEAAEHAERRGDLLEAARGLRHLARALALAGDAAAPRAIELATEANAAIDSAIGLAQLDASTAILRARAGDAAGADQLLQRARDALDRTGAVNDVMTTRLLELVTVMIAGDAPRADVLAESIAGFGADGPAAVTATIAALLRGADRQSSHVELSDIAATAARWRAAAMAAA